MPSRQLHRGRHPQDDRLFAAHRIAVLRKAVEDLSYLYSRGYSETAAVTIVGNRYQLAARQRRAVQSAACSDDSLAYRRAHSVSVDALQHETVCIDGYNLLISVESALSGAFLFRGRDGYLRDLASLHGSYRRVAETEAALGLIGEALVRANVAQVAWLFDAPVSNSGRLRAMALHLSEKAGWPWTVELSANTDKAVASAGAIAVSSDSWILDRAAKSANLLDMILRQSGRPSAIIDLGTR